MIYAYRLKDRNSKEAGRVVEGFTIRRTWQFTSDPKAETLKKWPKVLVVESEDITSAKKKVDDCDKERMPETGSVFDQGVATKMFAQDLNDPLAHELEEKTLNELKDYAKTHGFDESEYSKLARSKLIEYIVVGMRKRKND